MLATLAVAGAWALAGCGTLRNLQGDGQQKTPQVYGGVAADLKSCQDALDLGPPRIHGWCPGMFVMYRTVQAVRFCGGLADVPLSAVGDTMTLPWTAGAAPRDTAPVAPPHEVAADER
jgi:uncharacterized protein YceK